MKRVLSLVLALVMVFGTIMPAFAEDAMTDSQAGKDLQSYGVIAGTENGLDESIVLTRAMMATILADLYGKKAEATAYAFLPSFTDVQDADAWYTPFVAFAEQQGWMVGDAEGGTFRPNDPMSAQEVNVSFLKALGYTVEWADVNAKAAELEIAVVAAEDSKVLRGEAFASLRAALDVPKMDETDTLGTALALTNYVAPTPAAPTAVAVSSAVSISNKVVEVKLDADVDAPTAVNAEQFMVKDAADAAVAVTAAKLAPWDSKNKTVLVTLETGTTAGTLYTITSGETSANFGGIAAETAKPTASVAGKDFNEITVTFNEAIETPFTITIAEKYGDKAELAVLSVEQTGKDTFKVMTADQKGSTLYTTEIEGAADFSGNIMTKDSADTFVGKAKPTAKQTLTSATAVTSTTAEVYFGLDVDATAAADIANYAITEKYGDKAEVVVLTAEVVAETTSPAKAQHVLLTFAADTKAATLYDVKVTNVGSEYGTVLADSQSTTFVGLAKDTTKLSAPTVTSTSNTELTLTFGTANVADYVNEATTADMITITEKYGDKAELAITKMTIKKNVITLTTAAQKAATLYDVKIATGIMDKAGNATTAELKSTVVGSGVATKIASFTSTVDSAGTTLTVVFDVAPDATQAVDISHYTIDNSIGYPTKAVVDSADTTGKTVKLTIPKTVDGKIYKLTVKNLNNKDGVAMATAGVTKTFVGKGTSATLATVEAVVVTDNQTIKIIFDRDVTDTTMAKVWTSSSNALVSGALLYSVNTSAPATNLQATNHYAYQDADNAQALVVRFVTDDMFKASQLTGTTTFTLGYAANTVKNTTNLSFAPNDTEPAAPQIISVAAIDKQTIRVYFDQDMENIADTRFFNANNFKLYETEAAAGTVAHTITNVYKVDAKTFDLKVSATLDKDSTGVGSDQQLYLYIATGGAMNLLTTTTDDDAEDAKIQDMTGIIELKADSTSKAYESRLFGTSTVAASGAITDVNIVMTDKQTMVIHWPEAMNATEAVDPSNFTIYDAATAGGTVNPAEFDLSYSSTTNQTTIKYAAELDAETVYYLEVGKDVSSANDLKDVQKSSTEDVALRFQFAVGTVKVAKPAIETVTVSNDKMQLTIKMTEEVAFGTDLTPVGDLSIDTNATTLEDAAFPYASSVNETTAFTKADLLAVFGITAQFANETSADAVAGGDIVSVQRNKDGKTFVVTFLNALELGSNGSVTTENAGTALYMYNQAHVSSDRSSDATATTFGVANSTLLDTTATLLLSADLGNGATANQIANSDTIALTFNADMNASTMGTSFDVTVSNAGASVITIEKAGTTTVVATITTTGAQFNSGGADMTFNTSAGVWSAGNTVLTITLANLTGGTAQAAQTVTGISTVCGAGAVGVDGLAADTTAVTATVSQF